MKKVLLLIALGAALTSCEGELEKVMEQVVEMKEETNKETNKEGITKTDKVEDVNFRIFKDRTQTGKERPQ